MENAESSTTSSLACLDPVAPLDAIGLFGGKVKLSWSHLGLVRQRATGSAAEYRALSVTGYRNRERPECPDALATRNAGGANQRTTQSEVAMGAFHCSARFTKDEEWLCMGPESGKSLAG